MNFESERKIETKINKFDDLRGKDMSFYDLSEVSVNNLVTTSFDTKTKWPSSEKLPPEFDPRQVLEKGKNPGLGLRKLHAEGVTGEGVQAAIIDQKLLPDHEEYKGSISAYEEIGEQDYPSQMHGSAVTSILVGKKCGVAPEATVFYEAVPCGRNFTYFAKGLENIINHNDNSIEKIRVVSCSIGYQEDVPEEGLDQWVKMLEQAKEENILVIHCSMPEIDFAGCGNQEKDNLAGYKDWLNNKNRNMVKSEAVRIPTDYRTFASNKGVEEYEYDARGELSWAVPYLAGIVCLMLQVDPYLSREEIFYHIRKGNTTNDKNLKIINPQKIISSVRQNLSK